MKALYWFKNLKIKNKLLFVSSLIFLIIFLTILTGIYGILRIQKNAELMHSFILLSIIDITAMDDAFSKIDTDLWFITYTGKSMRPLYEKEIKSSWEKLYSLLQKYENKWCITYSPDVVNILRRHKRLSLINDEKKTVAGIKKVLELYEETSAKIIKLSKKDKNPKGKEDTLKIVNVLSGTVHEGFERLLNVNSALSLETHIEAKNIFRRTLGIMAFLFFLCITVGISASLFLAMTILAPINELSNAAKKISHGEYPAIPVRTGDEFGELASTFNLMSKTIEDDLQTISQSLLKVKNSEMQWEETFNAMPYGVSIHDMDFNILRVNSFLLKLLRVKKEEIEGKKCYEVFHGTDRTIALCPLMQTMASGKAEEAEFFEQSLNMHLKVMSSPMKDEEGTVYAFVHSIIDITEMKKAEKKILNMFNDIHKAYIEQDELFYSFIRAMVNALEAKSPWTKGHSERVAMYSEEIAKEMGLDEKEIKNIRLSALLHDIGKIGTYDYLLDKPAGLTEEEFELVKRHPAQGVKILKDIRQLKDILPLIRHHHERIDGRGYPDGLKGDEIPFGARILHVADSFDSMTMNRPYRPSPGIEYACLELKRCKGTQFDPQVVSAFLRVLEKTHKENKIISSQS